MTFDKQKLIDVLKNKYGERFEYYSFKGLVDRGIACSVDSKNVYIKFKSTKYLLIVTSADEKNILDELLVTFTEALGNQQPICSYDLESPFIEESKESAIEWNFDSPESRIKEIVNGRAFADGSNILNLRLNNGKNISDYLESEQEKIQRIQNTRIVGLDPGDLEDTERTNNLSEIGLWLDITNRNCGWYTRNKYRMPYEIIDKQNIEGWYAFQYMVYQTRKFGVETLEPQINRYDITTPSFGDWCVFWKKYYQSMTDEEHSRLRKAVKEGKDLSEFMPSEHRKNLLEGTKKIHTKTLFIKK